MYSPVRLGDYAPLRRRSHKAESHHKEAAPHHVVEEAIYWLVPVFGIAAAAAIALLYTQRPLKDGAAARIMRGDMNQMKKKKKKIKKRMEVDEMNVGHTTREYVPTRGTRIVKSRSAFV